MVRVFGHKVFAPTGIGVLYGRKELLDLMPPWQGGGNMIRDVTFERTEYHDAPGRFEAGTGNIADAVGLGAAIDYLGKIGMEKIAAHEQGLIAYATKLLADVPGLRIIGTAAEKAGVVSFVLNGKASEGVGAALNQEGIAVRSGHHCAQPILRRLGSKARCVHRLRFTTHSPTSMRWRWLCAGSRAGITPIWVKTMARRFRAGLSTVITIFAVPA